MNWHSLERREIPQAPPGLWQQLIQLPALPEGHLETQVSPGCCSQVISCSQVLSPFYSQVSPCFQVLSPDPRCSLLSAPRCSPAPRAAPRQGRAAEAPGAAGSELPGQFHPSAGLGLLPALPPLPAQPGELGQHLCPEPQN